MQRTQNIGSKKNIRSELVSLYRELEQRIKSHSNKTRNVDGKSTENVEKMNEIKLQRSAVRMAIDELEKMSGEHWKSRQAHYRKLVNESRKVIDKKIL